MTKTIYVHPDCNEDFNNFIGKLPKDELLRFANNNNDVSVYNSLTDFQEAFNNENISDQGFIIFVEE